MRTTSDVPPKVYKTKTKTRRKRSGGGKRLIDGYFTATGPRGRTSPKLKGIPGNASELVNRKAGGKSGTNLREVPLAKEERCAWF